MTRSVLAHETRPEPREFPQLRSEGQISRRSYFQRALTCSWEEIWEAGPYYERIAQLMEGAQKSVIFVGWQLDSRLPMPGRQGRAGEGGRAPEALPETLPETLKDKLLRLCEENPRLHFYFLVWAHSYLYVVERETWQTRIWEELHPRIHFVFDNRHPFGGSHHEKICIVDGKTALCGGIDLCDERWDSPLHLYQDPRRSLDGRCEHHGPYHDLAVQVTGPVCEGILEHVAQRWRALTPIPFPRYPVRDPHLLQSAGIPVYLSRTVAEVDVDRRKNPIIREIEFLFRDLIQAARHRIILEGQYYWSREIQDLLIAKMKERSEHSEDGPFELILILAELGKVKSFTRCMASFELQLIERLEKSAAFYGARLLVGTPYVHAHGLPPKPVYIHSKVMIVDDRFLCIGSANLATRALRLDTELHLTLEARSDADHAHIRAFAQRLLAHWNLAPKAVPPPAEAGTAAPDSCSHPEIRFRRSQPRLKLAQRRSLLAFPTPWVPAALPWQRLFDPDLWWMYLLKRRLRIQLRERPYFVHAFLGSLVLLESQLLVPALAHTLFSAPSLFSSVIPLDAPAALASLLLVACAWLPLPFTWIAALSALRLGAETAIPLIFSAYLVASFTGYALARIFPSSADRILGNRGAGRRPTAATRIGLRRFKALLLALADPRLSVRAKILHQGIYFVPFPWFALCNGLLAPSALCAFAWAVARLAS